MPEPPNTATISRTEKLKQARLEKHANGVNIMPAPAQRPEPAKRTPDKPRKRRWQVLPPEGQGECDYDPETEPAFEDDSSREMRRDAAAYQATEARRLAKDYALLRRGTQPEEIRQARLKEVKAAAAAWGRLVAELEKRRTAAS